jgi:hypothetical protein
MTRDRGSWSGSGLLEIKRYPPYKKVAAIRLTFFPLHQPIQGTPYVPLEGSPLAEYARENAFSPETSIKMSVLATGRGSSFHR